MRVRKVRVRSESCKLKDLNINLDLDLDLSYTINLVFTLHPIHTNFFLGIYGV